VNQYRLEATPAVELDIEAAFEWYEGEEAGLGFQFLDELRNSYVRGTRLIPNELSAPR